MEDAESVGSSEVIDFEPEPEFEHEPEPEFEHEPEFVQDMNDFAAVPQLRLLLLVSGRTTAAHVLDICLGLNANGADVKVVCTPDSVRYINRPLLARLFDVYSDCDFPEQPGHGSYFPVLVNWASALIFAPLSANYLAKVTLGFSDDLFCQVANTWPYVNILNLQNPDGQQAAKPAFVFLDMEHMAYITHPTLRHFQELQHKGATVLPGNMYNAQDIVQNLVNMLGIPN